MRKIVLSVACVALAVLLSLGILSSMPKDVEALTAKPNIVFILTDDMRKDDLKYMPKTRLALKAKGMSFENAFVSNALCCPSRATIMRGQYSHNTGVWTNGNSSIGGRQAYKNKGNEQDNVATRLDAAGYRTGLFGKYLNGYGQTTGTPPGWDSWFAHVNGIGYYDYQINDDGTTRRYGSSSSAYETNVIASHAKNFVGTSAEAGVPFFAYVSPYAPHKGAGGKAVPAPRDRHTYDGLKASRPPSFNERNVSDKPRWIRKLPRLSDAKKADIDKRHEKRAESLQAVDDLVAGVVGKLRDKGVLSNTYVFFTSDNGWHEGEHRIKAHKWRPYEEDIHMPLLVRGPGVASGHQTTKLVLDTDYLPTFTNLACSSSNPCDAQVTQNWNYVPDGRSIRPVLERRATAWRDAILLEAAGNFSPAYRGIRTVTTGTAPKRKYVEYSGGARELYHLKSDPYELADRYKATSPPSGLASRLRALKTCDGNGCRAAENGQ